MLPRLPLLAWVSASATSPRRLQLDGAACHDLDGQEYCPADQACHPDGECDECSGHLTEDIDTHECIDRVVFSTHATYDAVSAVIWFIGAGLAMSAGVGGGGIFVPLGVILLRFPSKNSTGLSQASIFGASVAGLILNSQARHPQANRPLIDFDMALFLSPMEMAGALLGVIVQKILPTWTVIVLMATILGYTAFGTYKKGIKTLRKERAALRKQQMAVPQGELSDEVAAKSAAPPNAEVKRAWEEHEVQDDEASSTTFPTETPLEVMGTESTAPELEGSSGGTEKAAVRKAAAQAWGPESATAEETPGVVSVEEWLARDAATPWRGMGLLLVMWVALIVLLFLKGGKGAEGAVEYCSSGYWALTALAFVWLFGFSLGTGYSAVSKSIQKAAVDYPFLEGDVVWTWSKFRLYSCATFMAGMVAGLIGIGGGMVLGPMMLQLGILPQVSSATTATMIALTSSAAAMLFVTSGLVPPSYAATYSAIAFFGALVGKSYIDKLVKRCQLTSIIILILATIIAFASAMMTLNGIIIYNDRSWDFEGFNELC